MDNNDSKPQQTGGLKLMTVFIAVLALHVLVIGGFTVYHLISSGGDADLALDKTHKLKADGTVVTETTTPDTASSDKIADATAPTETATASAAPAVPATTGTATAATGSTTAPETATASTDTATPATAPAATPAPAPAPTQVAANPPAATGSLTPEKKSSASPIVLSNDDMGQTSTIPANLLPPPDEPVASNVPAAHPATAPAGSSSPIALTPKDGVTPMTAPAPIASTASAAPVKPAATPGPVHMPVTAPKPAATPAVASHDEHVSAPAHEDRKVASTHEAKKQTYTVKMTDTYAKIAESHHITVAELKAANHIKGSTPMKTGQKLIIPSGRTAVAKSGATHEAPAADSTASLSASPTGKEKPKHHYYTVTKGDTLKYIAKKFNTTPSAIEAANNLNGTKLAVGEKLRIPSHETHTVSSGTTSAALTDRVLAPVPAATPAPAPIEPAQAEVQPAPVEQPAQTPVATPTYEPQPTPASNPELTSLNF